MTILDVMKRELNFDNNDDVSTAIDTTLDVMRALVIAIEENEPYATNTIKIINDAINTIGAFDV
jgi:hypothetical protein